MSTPREMAAEFVAWIKKHHPTSVVVPLWHLEHVAEMLFSNGLDPYAQFEKLGLGKIEWIENGSLPTPESYITPWSPHPNCRCTWEPARPGTASPDREERLREELGHKMAARLFLANLKWTCGIAVPTREESIGLYLLERDDEFPKIERTPPPSPQS